MSDARIIERWRDNAEAWTSAVREGRIVSRVQVTDAAIVDAVVARRPSSVLDVGCGEGWLARELGRRGIDVLGVDAVADLIERARSAGGARFETISHEQIAEGAITRRFDLCVCNFSLLGEASTNGLIARVPQLLNPGGALLVQTLHPLAAGSPHAYRDGWREGSWCGIEGGFSAPAPWYFRTLQTWVKMYADAGLRIAELREPAHPQTALPLSMILAGIADA